MRRARSLTTTTVSVDPARHGRAIFVSTCTADRCDSHWSSTYSTSRRDQVKRVRRRSREDHDPRAAARGAGAHRRDPRQVRRARERPLGRSSGRDRRPPQAVRVLPRPAPHLPEKAETGIDARRPAPRPATSRSPSATRPPSSPTYVPDAASDAGLPVRGGSSKRRSSQQLQAQAYERLHITTAADLEANLRTQLEALNDVTFSDGEWKWFFTEKIAAKNEGIVEKTARIQEDHDPGPRPRRRHRQEHHADRQVEHPQQPAPGHQPVRGRRRGRRRQRATPLRRHDPRQRPAAGARRAQAARRGAQGGVQPDQPLPARVFWSDAGLFEYVQLFVISNGTHTKYYANTTRDRRIAEAEGGRRGKRQTSNTFEFTSWWTDANNKRIARPDRVHQDVLRQAHAAQHPDEVLRLRRRPHAAGDAALPDRRRRADPAADRRPRPTTKQLGTIAAGGYIWHTTGSGKTLTSASRPPSSPRRLHDVDKVAVRRRPQGPRLPDDAGVRPVREGRRQRLQRRPRDLKRQLEDPNSRIIVTTIQKLARFIEQNKGHEIYAGHVVLIFDECHRSQFGDMGAAIRKAFKRYHLFGFTGTPIFAENAGTRRPGCDTTEQSSATGCTRTRSSTPSTTGTCCPSGSRTRTPSSVADHVSRQGGRGHQHRGGAAGARADPPGRRLRPRPLRRQDRCAARATTSARSGSAASTRCSPPPRSRRCKALLPGVREAAGRAQGRRPGVPAAEDRHDLQLRRERGRRGRRPPRRRGARRPTPSTARSRDFLEKAIADYNATFGTSYDTSSAKFENYYKDLARRLKEREVDLVIVVNMFLTGFDATTLNTLVGRQEPQVPRPDPGVQPHQPDPQLGQGLRQHRLLPRTSSSGRRRARALRQQDARGVVLLKPYQDYHDAYEKVVGELLESTPPGEEPFGEAAEKRFVVLFGEILRAAQHPDLVRRVRRATTPSRRATCRTTRASTTTCGRSTASARTPRRSRSSTTSSSRSSSSSRSRSTSTTSSCSS